MEITFAVIDHDQSYYEFYHELLSYIQENFVNVQSGLQGDAWIWVVQDRMKVSLDTFYSMQFEIQSDSKNELVEDIITYIQKRYTVRILDTPIEH